MKIRIGDRERDVPNPPIVDFFAKAPLAVRRRILYEKLALIRRARFRIVDNPDKTVSS